MTADAARAASFHADLAALAWQVEMGADEAICDAPFDRFAAVAPAARQKPRAEASPAPAPESATRAAPEAESGVLAAACGSLDALRAAMADFDGCALKRGARNLVFADGNPAARVMVIGEAPGAEEDREGRPFVGRSGQLLDRMFAAIGLSRGSAEGAEALYITNVLPWRPPQNRDPSADEVAMMLPFLLRHVELADPDVVVVMGNAAAKAVLGTTTGITRLRGAWADWSGRPVMPMFHPAALLRNGELKKAAWADLLAIRLRLDAGRAP